MNNSKLDRNLLKTFYRRKILITGGTGSIGSEIALQLLRYKPLQIRIFSRDESKHLALEERLKAIKAPVDSKFFIGDIRDRERLEKAMQKVDIVFHTAALKHVPYCEHNSFEAIKTNIYGTQNVIDLAIQCNVDKVIAISTDKAVNPTSIMGITKLLMERMIISAKYYSGSARTKLSVVRFGNVLNSRGSVIPVWLDQIKAGGPVTVTDNRMKRFFMTISQAVRLVLWATVLMQGQEIFILKMEEKNIYQLAKEVIKKYTSGKKIKIKIIGIREGEKIKERLYTDEEKDLMLEKDKFYVILPNPSILKERHNKYNLIA